MSIWSFLGDLIGKGASTVAPITVTAAGSSLGANLGSSIGANAGSALGSVLANGGGGSSGGNAPAPSGGDAYNTVAPIEVLAPTGNSGGGGDLGGIDWGGALSSALASYGDTGGGGGGGGALDFSQFTTPAPALANLGGGNTVAPIEVTASQGRDGLPMGANLVAGAMGGVPAPTAGELTGGQAETEIEDEPIDPNESDEDRRSRLLQKYGPLGLLGLLGGKGLLAAGLLGASTLLNNGGGGGGGGPNGPAGTALNNLAGNNAANAKTLQAGALANLNGNLSGSGLNYIGRMVKNAQAAIRQRYAGMGMSGSTAEQQDLNSAAQSGVDMQFKIGQEMAQTGLNAAASMAGQSATIYAALMNAQTQKDSQLGNALANFAGAVAK